MVDRKGESKFLFYGLTRPKQGSRLLFLWDMNLDLGGYLSLHFAFRTGLKYPTVLALSLPHPAVSAISTSFRMHVEGDSLAKIFKEF